MYPTANKPIAVIPIITTNMSILELAGGADSKLNVCFSVSRIVLVVSPLA
jgi:hypothetical protein